MNILLQATVRVLDSLQKASEGAVTGHESPDMFDLMVKGGVIFYGLIIIFAWAIYLTIERTLYLSKRAKINNNMLRVIEDALQTGKIESAAQFASNEPTAQGQMLSTGLRFMGSHMREIESAMETKAQVELSAMESNLSYLSLIARVAPMFGFVGTIWGVIKIFYAISIDSNLSIGGISEGLYTKMITSLGGLFVGIVAFVAYSVLMRKVDRYAERLQEQALSFLEMINKSNL